MKYLFGFVILAVMVLGCAPRKGVGESSGDCTPQNITVEGGDRSLIVTWEPNCNKLIAGYNIYISEDPLDSHSSGETSRLSAEPFNTTPFSGDTEPDDGIEHFVAERLENGKKYHVSVQTILPDKTQARFSKEILTACSPHGKIKLSVRYKSDNDGYSFNKSRVVRADELANDLYFYAKNGKDVIASPRRLDGFLRDNKFALLNFKGDINSVKKDLAQKTIKPSKQRVEIKAGDWVLLETEDKMFVLLNVLGFEGARESRRVELFYYYSTIKGELFF